MDADILIFIIVAGATLLANWLSSFVIKKGENLATKQDIEDITKKIESVKAIIGTQQYIHQTRYQNEFNILKELTSKLVALQLKTVGLRTPAKGVITQQTNLEERAKREKKEYEEHKSAFLSLFEYLEENKPFLPEGIYEGAIKVFEISFAEGMAFRFADPLEIGYGKYYEEYQQNADKIKEELAKVILLIRSRVKFWEAFECASAEPKK